MLRGNSIVLRPRNCNILVYYSALTHRLKHETGLLELLLLPSWYSLLFLLWSWFSVTGLYSDILFHLLLPQCRIAFVLIWWRDLTKVGDWSTRLNFVNLRLIITGAFFVVWSVHEISVLLRMCCIARNAHRAKLHAIMYRRPWRQATAFWHRFLFAL